MRVKFGNRTMVAGAPKRIAWWLQARWEEYKSFPKGAFVEEAEWKREIPEDPTEEQLQEIIDDALVSQLNYVLAHAVSQKKASYIRLMYKTDITVPGSKVPLTRVSDITVRLQAKRAYESKTHELPWGEWDKRFDKGRTRGLFIHHSVKSKTKDKTSEDYGKILDCTYLRYYSGKCKKKFAKGEKEKLLAEGKEIFEVTSHRKEKYFIGNKEVDLDKISPESAEKAKKLNKGKPSDIFVVDINNILALGKE